MQPTINLELMSFVEQEILPRYNAFGRSHGLQHVQRVIRNAIDLARLTGADLDMVYAIAPTMTWVWRGRAPSIMSREARSSWLTSG